MKHPGGRVAFAAAAVTLLAIVAPGDAWAQEPIELPADATMEMSAPTKEEAMSMPSFEDMLADEKGEKGEVDPFGTTTYGPDRVTFRVYKWERGRTYYISQYTVANLCGDIDGCELRLGMYNWDNTGRVASRESLFYYNSGNRAWRAERSDLWGSDWNGVTEHVMAAWACYFTDGVYNNWSNLGDPNAGFGLLSWSQFNAECFLTIID